MDRTRLENLLLSLFDDPGLRRFVATGPEGDRVAADLPSGQAPLSAVVHQAVLSWERRGVSAEIRDLLVASFPRRASEILDVWHPPAAVASTSRPFPWALGGLILVALSLGIGAWKFWPQPEPPKPPEPVDPHKDEPGNTTGNDVPNTQTEVNAHTRVPVVQEKTSKMLQSAPAEKSATGTVIRKSAITSGGSTYVSGAGSTTVQESSIDAVKDVNITSTPAP